MWSWPQLLGAYKEGGMQEAVHCAIPAQTDPEGSGRTHSFSCHRLSISAAWLHLKPRPGTQQGTGRAGRKGKWEDRPFP